MRVYRVCFRFITGHLSLVPGFLFWYPALLNLFNFCCDAHLYVLFAGELFLTPILPPSTGSSPLSTSGEGKGERKLCTSRYYTSQIFTAFFNWAIFSSLLLPNGINSCAT